MSSNNKIYVNSLLMRTDQNNDTKFICNLGTHTEKFNKMVLQSIVIENKFTNFNRNGKYGNFSLNFNGTVRTIYNDYYLTQDVFPQWLQDRLFAITGINYTFTLTTFSTYDDRLVLTCTSG